MATMDIAQMPLVAKAALGLACIFITYQIFIQTTVGRHRRAMKREKGTLPAPWFSGFRDHVVGKTQMEVILWTLTFSISSESISSYRTCD